MPTFSARSRVRATYIMQNTASGNRANGCVDQLLLHLRPILHFLVLIRASLNGFTVESFAKVYILHVRRERYNTAVRIYIP